MNFDFPDELKAMREEARSFLADKCPRSAPRRILDGADAFDRALWNEMAGLGWIGASIPEAYGGVGLGHLAVCVLAEEIGAALAPVPFSSSVYLAMEALLLYGSEAQKRQYLPRLASGEIIGTFAAAELPGALALEKLSTRIADDRIDGKKIAVPDGDVADIAVVAARDAGQTARLAIVALSGTGVERETVTTFDPTRSHATLRLAGATAEVLPGARGAADIRRLLDRAAIMMAFEQLGGAQAALDEAVSYAKERYAFGRPIGSFQAIKHKLADMYVAVELARSNAYWGAWALETNASELPLAACVARVAASDAGWLTAKENLQTHGGMGYTWEGDSHLFYRRAKLLGLALGSTAEWKQRLANELRDRNDAGLVDAD